jgi:Ca2+-binding RTX toxin-like protein
VLPLIAGDVYNAVESVWEKLWNQGVTKFLDGDKPIIYGTVGDDVLDSSVNVLSPVHDYVSNGVILLGGVGSDQLYGGNKNDKLYGGTDNDTLTGNGGNDYLEGVQGNDTYIYNSGDGFDTIVDTDGLGKIQWNTLEIKGSTGLAPAQWQQLSNTVWRDDTNHITYSLKTQADFSQTLFIIGQNNDSLQIEHWVDTNLGITLGAGTPPPASPLLNGDQRAQLIGIEVDQNIPSTDASYNTYKWSATSYAPDGTLLGGVAEANFNDVIYGGSADETINGLGGNDALSGGAGKDTIDGGIGDDLIGGGAGSDIIYGGAGNDEILSAYGLSALLRLRPGEVWQPPTGAAWIQGSNWGVSINRNGNYTIYGGGPLALNNAPDIIFAGDGDDQVTGGLGDDYIDGGLNNDSLWGQGGNDVIDGGDGNDFIHGDSLNTPGFYETLAEINHGNDILDGGAGNDNIYGNGKNDVLFGGIGDDKLWGDDINETNLAGQYHGNDYLEGGDGKDQLVGGGMDDTLIGGAFNEGSSRHAWDLHTAANDNLWRRAA